MTSLHKIKNDLPNKFTRQQVLKTAKRHGYSYATANLFLEKGIFEKIIERVCAGKYKKITQ